MRAVLEPPRAEGEAWLTRYLWKGAVATHGVSAVALVGGPEEIAAALLEYRNIGVSQFILSGWPNAGALEAFSRDVLPLVREGERRD
jgi:alkanesulfonate monooxygenase